MLKMMMMMTSKRSSTGAALLGRSALLQPHLFGALVASAPPPVAPLPFPTRFQPPPSFKVLRVYSSGATSEKAVDVEVPLPMFGLAGKYASSLFVVAVRANLLEPILEELKEVVAAAEKSPVFSDFTKDMGISPVTRVKAIREFCAEAGFSEITTNVLALVAENGRLRLLPNIVDCLSELVMAYKGQVKAAVTATIELSPKEMEQLKIALKRFIKPGETLLLSQKIDRSILGGLVVDIGDKHIDLSIATRVKEIERILREPI